MSFNQVDIKTGEFKSLHKNIVCDSTFSKNTVELGVRIFIDNSDPIGLFINEPDSMSYLAMEGKIERDYDDDFNFNL